MSTKIQLYATTWCFACRRARAIMDLFQVPYQFINIDEDLEARAYVERVNKGFRSVPTILFPDGSLLVEPREGDLKDRLSQFQTTQ